MKYFAYKTDSEDRKKPDELILKHSFYSLKKAQ